MRLFGAAGATPRVSVGVWEVYTAIEGYLGMLTGDIEPDETDDGRSSRSGTCPPPFWK
jgi:hypothetical protein